MESVIRLRKWDGNAFCIVVRHTADEKKIMKIDLSRALPNNHLYSPQSDLSPKSDDEIEVEWRV